MALLIKDEIQSPNGTVFVHMCVGPLGMVQPISAVL